eukprot:534561-Karenia_brevis.AAC.1
MDHVNDRLCSIFHNKPENSVSIDNLFYDLYQFEKYCSDITATGKYRLSWSAAGYAMASLMQLSSTAFPPW